MSKLKHRIIYFLSKVVTRYKIHSMCNYFPEKVGAPRDTVESNLVPASSSLQFCFLEVDRKGHTDTEETHKLRM